MKGGAASEEIFAGRKPEIDALLRDHEIISTPCTGPILHAIVTVKKNENRAEVYRIKNVLSVEGDKML